MSILCTRIACVKEGGFTGFNSKGVLEALLKKSATYAKVGGFIVNGRQIVSIWPPIYENHSNHRAERSLSENIPTS